MAEIVLDIHTDDLEVLQTKKQNLSVLIGANRFYFFVSDANKRIILQRHYVLDKTLFLKELRQVLETDIVLRASFQQIKIAVDTPYFSFLPSKIFMPAHQRAYLQNVAPISTNDMVFTDDVEELSLKNVHAIDRRLFDLLDTHFPSFQLYHTATTLLRRTKRIATENEIIVNVMPDMLNIIVYKNNEFQLYNAFQYHSSEAFLYYILLMYQQFDLDTASVPLTLMGGIMPNSSIYRLLSTYVRQMRFAKRTKYYQFSPQYSTTPQQFYFDLYSLSVCE